VLKIYKPKGIYWIVRCNLVVFTEIEAIEMTIGLLGYGILISHSYRKPVDVPENKDGN
jgi:hypothetical protein